MMAEYQIIINCLFRRSTTNTRSDYIIQYL